MNARTAAKALNALDGMAEIVRHEMVTTGTYIEDEIRNQKLADQGAICGGRRHCAIGSLWVGYGIKPETHRWEVTLPGVDESEREDFLRNRPGLKVAYEALNEAARVYAEKHELLLGHFDAEVEGLFEHNWIDNSRFRGTNNLTKRELLRVISMAKRRIEKQIKVAA